MKKLVDFLKLNNISFNLDEPLKNHTGFKIGGNADILIEPKNKNELVDTLKLIKEENINFYIIGNGTNLLVSDKGFRGAIIKISKNYSGVTIKDNYVTALSGTPMHVVCSSVLDVCLAGLEFAYGIPGSIGGAVFMNAGAYGGEVKDSLISVEVYDIDSNSIKFLDASKLDLSYRHSIFEEKKNLIILSAKFKFYHDNKANIKARMDEHLKARKSKQPLDYPSAGSTFKRPGNGYYASRLIEDAHLKGYTIGGAQVSFKHSGFVINIGNATCKDVEELMEHVKNKVINDFGITLEPEVIRIGEK